MKILPDVILPDSLHEVRNRSLDRYRSEPVDLTRPVSPANGIRLRRQQAISRRDSMMTAWPHWVHNQYNATALSCRVKLQLSYLKLGMWLFLTGSVSIFQDQGQGCYHGFYFIGSSDYNEWFVLTIVIQKGNLFHAVCCCSNCALWHDIIKSQK